MTAMWGVDKDVNGEKQTLEDDLGEIGDLTDGTTSRLAPEEDTQEVEASQEVEEEAQEEVVEKKILFSDEELKKSYAILTRYQVDTSAMSDDEVVLKTRKILGLSKANVQVLSRGRTLDGIDRLLSYLPDGYVGEFKREDSISIARAKGLGWEPFHSEEASKDSLTGKGDSLVRLADQILMMMPEDNYIALQVAREVRHATSRAARTPKKEAAEGNRDISAETGEEFLAPVRPV